MATAAYQTPGVYYEHLDATPPAVTAIRMDVAGFVGIARRGPLDLPVPVQSWRQFEAHFGGVTGAGYLGYAVRAFFENGGLRCWVVRVASKEDAGGARAAEVRYASAGGDGWRIAASSPGVWGNRLAVTIQQTHRVQAMTIPLRSTPEAAAVAATTGFDRYTLVRLSQEGFPSVLRVVSDVDAHENLLYWLHPDPKARTPYDSPMTSFDPDRPVLIESVEYTLLVFEAGRLVRRYEALSLIPEHPRYGPTLLAPISMVDEADALPPTPEPVEIEEERSTPLVNLDLLDLPAEAPLPLTGGSDGLALLQPYDFMGEPFDPVDSDATVARKRRGFRALDSISEVAAVAIPDLHIQPVPPPLEAPLPVCIPDPCLEEVPADAPPRTLTRTELPPVFSEEQIFRVQDSLVTHCELRRDRLAVLDPPFSTATDVQVGLHAVQAWRRRFDSDFAVLYWPWLRVVDPLRGAGALTRAVPPSGHAAGQWARTDRAIGVHKAPANAPLVWVQDVTLPVDDETHGLLNTMGINVFRVVSGRGIRIMGARTVSSNATWRYVNVRRLLLMIARALYISSQWAVFEPNDAFTRAKLRLAFTSFLLALWRKGALVGGTAEAAFFVKCDEDNNPPHERDRGRLLAEIGVAPANPFEFVVVRVGRTDNEFELSEPFQSLRGA